MTAPTRAPAGKHKRRRAKIRNRPVDVVLDDMDGSSREGWTVPPEKHALYGV